MATVTVDATLGATRVASNVEYRTTMIECAGSPATTESRAMVDMFKGEKVVEVFVDADALGASTSYSCGNSLGTTIDNAARFIATTTSTSATTARINTLADVGRGYTFTADGTVDVTAVGAGAWTGTVRVTVLYVRSF